LGLAVDIDFDIGLEASINLQDIVSFYS